jgi:hypothetical protein
LKVLVRGEQEEKGPHERPVQRWEDSIKMGLKEIGWNLVTWINLSQCRDKWRDAVNIVMNLGVP